MLTVFRSDFPGGSGPAGDSVVVRVGKLEAELVWPLGSPGRCGSAEEETALLAAAVLLLLLLLAARAGSSEPGEERAEVGAVFETRVFATGSEGSGPVGGAMDGREGRGRVWLVMAVAV